jgi:hypothetical protein
MALLRRVLHSYPHMVCGALFLLRVRRASAFTTRTTMPALISTPASKAAKSDLCT